MAACCAAWQHVAAQRNIYNAMNSSESHGNQGTETQRGPAGQMQRGMRMATCCSTVQHVATAGGPESIVRGEGSSMSSDLTECIVSASASSAAATPCALARGSQSELVGLHACAFTV